jgi:hypothetical protein
MRLLHRGASDWIEKAKKARRAAESLIDADAKEVMLELSLLYLGKAVGRVVEPDDCPVVQLRLVKDDLTP